MGCDFNLAEREWVEEDNVELRKFLTRDEIKIQELEEENTTLKQSVEWYKNREKELLKQIEDMKNCFNCKHYHWSNGDDYCDDHYGQPMYDEECKDKWELR